MEDWAEIRRLHRAEGMPIKAIVRHLGVARNTVRAALASDAPPAYRRASRGSLVDAVEPEVRKLLRVDAKMPATVIAERIGWEHSITILKDRVRQIRPEYAVSIRRIGSCMSRVRPRRWICGSRSRGSRSGSGKLPCCRCW